MLSTQLLSQLFGKHEIDHSTRTPHPCCTQFLMVVLQALVPIHPFQLHARRLQPKKANAAILRSEHRIHPCFAKHAFEVDLLVILRKLFIMLI